MARLRYILKAESSQGLLRNCARGEDKQGLRRAGSGACRLCCATASGQAGAEAADSRQGGEKRAESLALDVLSNQRNCEAPKGRCQGGSRGCESRARGKTG